MPNNAAAEKRMRQERKRRLHNRMVKSIVKTEITKAPQAIDIEGNRERLQPFEGVVMRLRGGGVNRNFTVRRITHGVGVERTFLLHSPRIEKIEVVRHARVRRKQLYFLRGLTGKAARLKELRPMTSKEAAAKEVATAARSRRESAQSGGESTDE